MAATERMIPPCCPEGALPFAPEDPNYQPKGTITTFNGVEAYVVGSGTKALIFIHDIFGMRTGLNKILCDKYSEGLPNYLVVAPNFYQHGDLCPNDPLPQRGSAIMNKLIWPLCTCKLFSYVAKCSWDNGAGDVFNRTTAYLLSQGVTDIVLEGNCWGSYCIVLACANAQHKEYIRAGIHAHPSLASLAGMYKINEMELVNQIHCPQLIAATKTDDKKWKVNGEVTKVLAAKAGFGHLCAFYDYNEAHGFFTRGDTKNEPTRKAIEDLLNKSIVFINKVVPNN